MPHKAEPSGTDTQSIIANAGSFTSVKDLQKSCGSKPSKNAQRVHAWVHETQRERLTINELLHQRANIAVIPETTKDSNSIIVSANASFG